MTNLSSTSEEPEMVLLSGFGLGPRELDIVFPFHFVIDSETRVVRAGPAIQRLLPGLAGGEKIDSLFRIKHPANLTTYKEICEHSDQLFLLEARSLDKLLLKGQMLYLPHADAIVFIGAPWLTDSSDIGALGLSLNDFSIHDSVPDYLLLLHTLTVSLGDAQVLAEQLNAMNRQLEKRIEERTQEVISANATLTETNRRLLQEIAERKRAEESLLESEATLHTILDNAPVGIWLAGVDKRYRFVNKTFCDAVGIAESRFLAATHLPDLLGAEIGGNCMKSDQECLAKETPHISYEELTFVDGKRHLMEITKVKLRDHAGMIAGAIGVAVDITERKQYEVELKRSNAELEQFSYAVSHDMRQPLRMISSYLQLIEMSLGGQLDGEKRGYFNFAIEGAKRIDQMLVALLEYSRVGKAGGRTAWIESRAVLDEALQFLQPMLLDEAQAKLVVTGDWPRIFASHDEILRLIQNLIGNAAKYRIAGRTPEITVTSEVIKNEWCLCVADNGIGIIHDQIKRLFQIFQRLQLRTAYEGNGVGLALCRKIAEHHKGRIWAESAGEGKGSRFYVVLPVLRERP